MIALEKAQIDDLCAFSLEISGWRIVTFQVMLTLWSTFVKSSQAVAAYFDRFQAYLLKSMSVLNNSSMVQSLVCHIHQPEPNILGIKGG